MLHFELDSAGVLTRDVPLLRAVPEETPVKASGAAISLSAVDQTAKEDEGGVSVVFATKRKLQCFAMLCYLAGGVIQKIHQL